MEASAHRTPPALTPLQIQEKIASHAWFHRIEVAPGIFTPGPKDAAVEMSKLGIPEDLTGLRVLDIGAAEGFNSFECERRGAHVTSVDKIGADESGFGIARELLGSKIKHYHCSIYNLDFANLGEFDIILFTGVLYHLRYPLLALDVLKTISSRALVIVESQICDGWFIRPDGSTGQLASYSPELLRAPLAQFYPRGELCGDTSTWYSTNIIGLAGMLESAGFDAVLRHAEPSRAVFHCRASQTQTPSRGVARWEFDSVRRPVCVRS